MEQDQLTSAIESILFAADRPVTLERLKEVFAEEVPTSDEELKIHLSAISEKYKSNTHGFELREAQGGYHFVTKIENANWVRRFLMTKPFKLGRSAMETLAIIAYRQPITRAEIDSVRGIDCSHLLRTLMERGLVKMAGKAEIPGRPVQYSTTPKFLEVVGVKTVAELPPLSELEQLQGNTAEPADLLEEGLSRFISETRSELAQIDPAEDEAGLNSINEMIQSAHKGTAEVHESPLHAEIAEDNQAAAAALAAQPRPRRKPKAKEPETIRYEDLTAGAPESVQPELPITDQV